MSVFGSLAASTAKKAVLTAAKKGKTESQKKVIDYFLDEGKGGCLSKKGLTDEDYDTIVRDRINSINFEEKAFAKLGIDKSQITEVEPIITEGYYTYSSDLSDDKLKTLFKIWRKTGEDEKVRTSAYQRTYMYFSDNQVFIYQIVVFMDRDDINEYGKEFFYNDITSFTTKTTTEEHIVETRGGCFKKPTTEKVLIERTEFKLVVPGDEFCYSLYDSELRESSIQGMKAKYRDAKISK